MDWSPDFSTASKAFVPLMGRKEKQRIPDCDRGPCVSAQSPAGGCVWGLEGGLPGGSSGWVRRRLPSPAPLLPFSR